MSAFQDYYIPKVEEFLGRKLTESEKLSALKRYREGWHPKRLAEFLKNKK